MVPVGKGRHSLKKENKKAETKHENIESRSKRSFELDPTLKDLASTLKERCSTLREEEKKNSYELVEDFEKLYPDASDVSNFLGEFNKLPELKSDFKESLNKIASVFSNAFSDTKECEEIKQEIQKLLIENFFKTARAISVAVEARDPYTGGHSDRVFKIAKELGKRCNITASEQLHLEGGSLLHDVGKIAIRDGVLLKPGPLTNSEYKEMQLHTVIGAQIVKKMDCLHGCIDAILLHHERIDGYGYPFGLKASEIPLIARITSVADAYDAMTTNRIYRKALNHDQALEEIIRNSGTQFDPEVVRVFIKWWEDHFQASSKKSKNLQNEKSSSIVNH